MKSYSFLFWAYNVIWLVIAGYMMLMMTRMKRIDQRLGRIEKELEREGLDD